MFNVDLSGMNKTCSPHKKIGSRTGPFHISQKVDYGLFLLAALATDGGDTPRSIRTIAKDGHVSFSFLQKIAHILKDAQLISAQRGKTGGYRLGRSAGSITLKDIVEALDGKMRLAPCLVSVMGSPQCPRQKFCRIRSRLRSINNEIEQYYLSKKLSDIISFSS